MQTLPSALLAVSLLGMGCTGPTSETPPGPNPTTPGANTVDARLRALPSWSEFSPPLADVPAQPVAGENPLVFEVEGSMEVITDEDADEDGVADIEVVEDVVYTCTTVPYTLTDTPERIVMYNPDVELLWPGALLQGASHAAGLGALDALPIAERAPLEVSIPALSTGENFRRVESPSQAQVASAIGEMVGNAVADDLVTPSTITFEEKTYHSETEFALSLNMSGNYMGFEGSASGNVEQTSQRTTVTAQFFERMFEVVVAPPSTPAGFFSEDFTDARYDEQEDLGRIGDDNLPIYVSNVVYGRMMTFSLTSTASESEIRATLSAAYEGLVGSGEVNLDVRQQAILAESTIAVSSVGGDAEATVAMIRSGNWAEYFASDAPLSSAAPLSYTFRNLGDNSIAHVSESTEYDVTSCSARAQSGALDFLEGTEHTAPISTPFTSYAGDFDGDGFGDVLWNHRSPTSNEFYVGYGQADGSLEIGPAWVHPEAAAGGWGNYDLHIGDVDGDGADDLIWNRLEGDTNAWYVVRFSAGTAVFDAMDAIDVNGWNDNYVLNVGDIDNDGKDDLHFTFVADPGGGFRVYKRTNYDSATGFEVQDTEDLTSPYAAVTLLGAQPVLADFDGDGRKDLVARRNEFTSFTDSTLIQRVVWAPGDGTVELLPAAFSVEWQMYAGPFTGTGGDDLILKRVESNVPGPGVGLLTQDLGYQAFSGPAIDNFADYVPTFGDIDGDGRQDIVWNRMEGASNLSFVGFGRADGMDLNGTLQAHAWPIPDWDGFDPPLALDVNGDGRDDLVWTRSGPTVETHVALGSNLP